MDGGDCNISVRITNIRTGQDLYCNKVHADQVYTIQMYPTGKCLNEYPDRKTNTIQCADPESSVKGGGCKVQVESLL